MQQVLRTKIYTKQVPRTESAYDKLHDKISYTMRKINVQVSGREK